MKKINNIISFVNEMLPSGWQLVDVFALSERVGDVLSEKFNMIKNDFDRYGDFSPSVKEIRRGNKITVSSEHEKNFMLESGWFQDSEVTVEATKRMAEEDSKAITEMAKKVLESATKINYANHFREMNDSQIRLAQDACYARMKTDPIFSGAINQLINYIVGERVGYSCQVPEIEDVLTHFHSINHYNVETSLSDRVVRRHLLEGEQFVFMVSDKVSGDCYATHIETYEIEDWEFHPRWRDTVLAYKVNVGGRSFWVADYRYFDEVYDVNSIMQATSLHHAELDENQFIIHIKESVYPEFRGRPLATAALRYFKYAEDFLYDRVILNHERSRVVWIRKILGRAATQLANFLTPPPGGVMLNETEDITYSTVNSEINADDVKEDYLSIIYAIASCFMMPIHVLNMRANEQVYASVLSSKAPFTKAILKWQDFFSRSLYKIHKVVVREKMKVGLLKEQYSINVVVNGKEIIQSISTVNIPITHIFPNPVDEKLAERTKHEEFMINNKIASFQTIREKNGLSNSEELRRMADEQEEWQKVMDAKKKSQPKEVSKNGGK